MKAITTLEAASLGIFMVSASVVTALLQLLDTQCWLWWFAQPERLNEEAIAHIADETNALWLSVASIWEMGIKVAIGKVATARTNRQLHF